MKTNMSYDLINYTLRPKKQIERKIFIELINKVQTVLNLNIGNYRYLGFGSIYYQDFIMFHKFLNINKMTSIDSSNATKRFNFNKPYDFIEFHNAKSTDFISRINYKENLLTWLDYDSIFYFHKYNKVTEKFICNINKTVFDDIALIYSKSKINDIFALSINIKMNFIKEVMQNFENDFQLYLPSTFAQMSIKHKEEYFSSIVQQILINKFIEIAKHRDLKFTKLFSFEYADGAPMYTLGGIFEDKNNLTDFSSIQDNLLNKDIKSVTKINVPLLTFKEKYYLDSKIKEILGSLKNKNKLETLAKNLDFEIDDLEKLEHYANFYKYYPQYFEGLM